MKADVAGSTRGVAVWVTVCVSTWGDSGASSAAVLVRAPFRSWLPALHAATGTERACVFHLQALGIVALSRAKPGLPRHVRARLRSRTRDAAERARTPGMAAVLRRRLARRACRHSSVRAAACDPRVPGQHGPAFAPAHHSPVPFGSSLGTTDLDDFAGRHAVRNVER